MARSLVITRDGSVKQLPEKEAQKLVRTGEAKAVAYRQKMTNDVEPVRNDN